MMWSDVCFQVSLEETEEATPLVWETGAQVTLRTACREGRNECI